MDSSSVNKHQRSHSGCARCKRRRQKCDEKRPCGRCSKAHVECKYSVNLRWGGRSFDRSRFGDCLKAGARMISGDEHKSFVYTALASSQNANSLGRNAFQPFPSLSMSERRLLFHFTSEGSRVTCCNPHVQNELCALIVPMAVELPALMNATLAWSAMQCMASYGIIPGETLPESTRMIAKFKARSIESLRKELQAPISTDALLATIRTLCQCEIHSGSDQLSTWRVHIKGAKALMNTVKHSQASSSIHSRLLHRWYASLDSLAVLSSFNSPTEDSEQSGDIGNIENVQAYLDDYNGYATDLSHLLGRIGNAVATQKRLGYSSKETYTSSEATLLETAVCQIMERDNSATPVFYPGVIDKLSPQSIQEYAWCNQAYQHTALIYIRRRLHRLPTHSPEIQDSVKTIVECARSIAPAYGLSPSIVLTTPLFTAGCEALGEDREAIRELLSQLYSFLKIRNISLALEALESYWSNSSPDDDIEVVLRRQNWDFIPY